MKKLLISLTAVVLIMVSFPACTFAATNTVTTKMYEIYATKNYVYVSANKGIYRVKLSKGKPVSKKRLYKCGSKYGLEHLKVKGKFVYFKKSSDTKEYLYRVKKSGGTAKKLATMGQFSEVAFTSKRIYYTYPGETDENGMVVKTYKKVMKLNGTGKKNTSKEAVEKDKYYNKKGYKFVTKVSGSSVVIYLKTPKGKIALEKI